MNFPSFEELAELIRTSARLGRKQRIDPDTQLLHDLKLNEKQVISVGIAIEQHFGIRLSAEVADQLQDMYAFQSENSDKGPVIQALFAPAESVDHPWTVGWLYRAVLEELSKLPKVVVRQ